MIIDLECVDCGATFMTNMPQDVGNTGCPPHKHFYGWCDYCDGFLQLPKDAKATRYIYKTNGVECQKCPVFNSLDSPKDFDHCCDGCKIWEKKE